MREGDITNPDNRERVYRASGRDRNLACPQATKKS
jgi:hypothetical protein